MNDRNQKNIINSEDSKNVSNKNIKNKINELSFINNDLSKNIMAIKDNCSVKQDSKIASEDDYNKMDNNSYNKEDNKNIKDNMIINKKNITKDNFKFYTETFCKILGVNLNEIQNKKNFHSFSLRDYLYFIINKKNNVKTKIIDKLINIYENTLSVEEIIRRSFDLEILISHIQLKFGKEFNLNNYMETWMKKDVELEKLFEDENKKIKINKL